MIRDDIPENDPLSGYWMEGDSLAPPCQSDDDVVSSIVRLADLTDADHLMDLGCGDGRICIQASRVYGAKSTGVEIEPRLIEEFEANVAAHELNHLVNIVQGDLVELDLTPATVITLYLLPEAIELIKPKLVAAIDRGCRIICHTWGPKGVTPTERVYCGQWNNVTLLYYKKRES
jgi:ubiquinone/menaquinone biosynthesis C-methylase UbiE